jgi:threonine dehydratase
VTLTFQDIQTARVRITPYVNCTPLRRFEHLRKLLGFDAPVFLKLDNLQNTGSFKVRGGANKLLALKESGRAVSHVVAASAGNHAQAVAFVAGKLGIRATIVMPEGAPLVKAAATRDYGAEVILHGSVYDEAFAKAQEVLGAHPGSVYVHAYEDPLIMAGQGTLGVEVHEQLLQEGCETQDIQIVVPIGGGGLISGVATAMKHLRPSSQIFGVVGQAAPAMAESFERGELVASTSKAVRTLAEGLAVKKVSAMTFGILKPLVKQISVVSEDEIAGAISTLMERAKLVVEGSGAAGVAAAVAKKLRLDPKKPTVFVLCGGNIDMNLISNILERGLVKNGRRLPLVVRVEDRPGQLAKITDCIGQRGANILSVDHDRTSPECPMGMTRIRLELETRGPEHVQELIVALEKIGLSVEKSLS